MKCEIEFLAVGDASRAGDCIVVRYGETDMYDLMVVDGGTAATGEALVAHLKSHFGENVRVEHVVLTHSDADHASGLRELFKEIPVGHLWMHIPWLLALEARPFFADKTINDDGLKKKIRDEYAILEEILELAVATPCEIHYPFQGAAIGPFTVMSPQRSTYLHLLPQFEKTPDPDQAAIEAGGLWIGKATSNVLVKAMEAMKALVQEWIPESWSEERLKDGGVTSASNESSVVLYANLSQTQRLLLTGDAGENALQWSINYANRQEMPLQSFSFVQVPHHGSRRNVGPTVLNQLIGPIKPEGTVNQFHAFVSAPKDDSKHPRKIVLNAFIRRGGGVYITQGQNKVHWGGFPPRGNYDSATAEGFSTTVEQYD